MTSQTNVAFGDNSSGRAVVVRAANDLNAQRTTGSRKHFLESYAEHLAAQRSSRPSK
ncbi:MAG: hypothetical protein ACK4TP_16365 [Hyphomicrobium sp.]|jgi:hypothetical protein